MKNGEVENNFGAVGLPKDDWGKDTKNRVEEYRKLLQNNIFKTLENKKEKYFEYVRDNRIIAKVVKKGGKYDAPLKYFDMSKYFTKETRSRFFKISEQDLKQHLIKDILKQKIKGLISNIDLGHYKKIFDTLNAYMKKNNRIYYMLD